jgi:hypothetical protein
MTTNQPGDTNRALRNIIDRSDWRQTLVEDYTATAQRLLEAYQRTLPMLQESANALTQRMSEWNALNPNDPLSSGQVKGLKEFQDLIRRVEVETRDFASLLRNEAAGIQDRAVQIGADGALEMAQKTSGGFGAEIATAWNRVAPEALGALIGYVDGDPFRERTAMFGERGAGASNALADILSGDSMRFRLPALFTREATVANKTLDYLEGKINRKTMDSITKAMRSGRSANEAIDMLPMSERNHLLLLLKDSANPIAVTGVSAAQ